MTKSILRYLLALLSNQVITIVSQIVLIPIFLTRWSATIYGEWLALSSLPSYLGNLDFGMNMAATNRLTELHAQGKLDLYRRTQHSAIAYYTALAATVTIVVGGLVWGLPITHWLHIRDISPTTASLAVWLLTIQVLWRMPIGQIGNIFRAIGYSSTTAWIGNMSALIGLAATIITLLLGGNIVAVATVQLLPPAFVFVATLVGVRHQSPELMPGISHAEFKLARELLKPGALFGVIMVATALNIQAPILLVAKLLDGRAVVAFATVRTMVNMARQAVMQVNHSIEPEITRLYARQDFARLRSLHRLSVAGTSTISIAVAGALWFHGVDVVHIWTHGKVNVQPSFLHLMLMYVVLHVIWLASSTFVAATNNHRRLAWQYLTSNLIAILFSALTIRHMGLNAVPIGLILGDLIACYHFVIRDTCQLCREPYLAFAVRTWICLVCVITVSLSAGLLSRQIHAGPASLHWLLAGAMALGASLYTTWRVWFIKEDRAFLTRKWNVFRGNLPFWRSIPVR